MSDTAKKIAYALDTEARITRELLNAQPMVNGSITIHFHEGWFKRYEITITGKPETIRGITARPKIRPGCKTEENPQEGNS